MKPLLPLEAFRVEQDKAARTRSSRALPTKSFGRHHEMEALDFGRRENCQFFGYPEGLWKRNPFGAAGLKLVNCCPRAGGNTDQVEVYLGFAGVDCTGAENVHKLLDATYGVIALERYRRKILDFQSRVSPVECLARIMMQIGAKRLKSERALDFQ